MRCPTCGQENPEGAKQCSNCGGPLTATAEAAIKPRTDPNAITSLVLGILGFTCIAAVPGLIFGILALSHISKSKGKLGGQGMAIAGVVLSGLAILAMPFVAIFAATLFPVFSRAREKARQTTCLANTKQIMLGVLMFADDHNETLPTAENWSDAIMPYIKSEKVFVCPDVKDLRSAYAFNRALSGKNLGEFENPAELVVIFESDLGWNGSGEVEDLPPTPRHAGGDNFGFLDLHAKWFPREEAMALQWEP